MSVAFDGSNMAKLLAPILERRWNNRVRNFDSDDFEFSHPITECPDCGYDGEGLEERVAELEAEIALLKGVK